LNTILKILSLFIVMPNNTVNTSQIAVTISEPLPKQFCSWPREHEYLFYFIIFTFIPNSSDTSTQDGQQQILSFNKESKAHFCSEGPWKGPY